MQTAEFDSIEFDECIDVLEKIKIKRRKVPIVFDFTEEKKTETQPLALVDKKKSAAFAEPNLEESIIFQNPVK